MQVFGTNQQISIKHLAVSGESVVNGHQKVFPGFLEKSTESNVKVLERLKTSGWSIPKEGFLYEYLKWAVPRTEAPLGFHLAAAILGTGILLGRKCRIVVGDLTFYPNIYAVCVGQSTLVRKTHSTKMLRRILKKVEKLLRLSDGFFLADDGTPEGLLEELLQKERGIKVFQEFGDFLKQTKKKDYLGGFTGLLTELYDCPSTYSKQLSKSHFQILEPFLCLFGATTREWLVDGMEESDIHGGFLARFLLFPGNEETQLIPITPPRDEQAEQKLAQQLAELYEISGTFEPTEEAKETYAKWYRRHRNELKSPGMGLLSSYYGRLEGYVWKIAFIFEAATNLSLNSVSTDSVKLAIDFVERLKKDLKPLILSDFQPSYWAKTTNKVVRLIRSAGSEGIIRSTLLRSTHLKAKQLTEVLDWLREAGEIRDKPNGTKGTRYCAVTKDESSQHSQAQLRRISL